jgi:hypothetical protein
MVILSNGHSSEYYENIKEENNPLTYIKEAYIVSEEFVECPDSVVPDSYGGLIYFYDFGGMKSLTFTFFPEEQYDKYLSDRGIKIVDGGLLTREEYVRIQEEHRKKYSLKRINIQKNFPIHNYGC